MNKTKQQIIINCEKILIAYKNGSLGQTIMPEDTNPHFESGDHEQELSYFTLPMSLNYQRNSYHLWEAALKSYQDNQTLWIFDINQVTKRSSDLLREALIKHKLALQPNKHINTWHTIAKTITNNWGSIENLITNSDNDFLKLQKIIRIDYKAGLPYLSGPKIFNYWCFILSQYCKIKFKNAAYIDIAPDTHITKCSIKLGIITEEEAKKISKEQLSQKWRNLLTDTSINPIDMHSPLWFWSRNGFIYEL